MKTKKQKSIRVTFTLKRNSIDLINHYSVLWNLSKSKLVSLCMESGFELMEEEKNDEDVINHKSKKFRKTIPLTVTLASDVVEKLDYYSKLFKWKKSHLVFISIYYKLIDKINQQLEDEIEELMDSSEI
ncbi:MAG: hypothetical protein NTW78_06130 [Campylobacterales bacterium]|nr:hypothetical protein [Campylobacterales bacterium]